ncbi:MAG: rod shape-determining protein MreD [Paludibacteraceae bacterium]|nr:rod shape-determining protein MreD [Paludibacteraceae bacterium]
MIWIEHSIRLVVVLLLQLLLINNLHFLGVVNPCIYILFLLALPNQLPRWAQLLIAFVIGLVVDIFCNSLGVHTFACTAMMYVRHHLLSRLVQDEERLVGSVDSQSLGLVVWIKYLIMLTLIHHTLVFMLSAFTFHAFWLTLLQIFLSSVVTILLLLLYEVARSRKL